MEYKVIKKGNKEIWYHNGNIVKKIGYHENGKKYYEYYFLNGNRHNENGPAFIEWFENGNKKCEYYYLDGKLHNENGPAIFGWYEDGNKKCEYYYLDGEKIKKEELTKKSINIGGKEVSEETILIALKNYFN